jgi:hypothetical protein
MINNNRLDFLQIETHLLSKRQKGKEQKKIFGTHAPDK